MEDLEIGGAPAPVKPLARKAKPQPAPAATLGIDGASALDLDVAPVLEGTIEPEVLATVEPDKRLAVFSSPGGLRPILDVIAQVARAHKPDITTEAGRKAIASVAYQVAKCKTRLDEAGKELVAELKALPTAIDANRRAMRDEMDALKDEVRQGLTVWEESQERQKRFIAGLGAVPIALARSTAAEIEASLEMLENQSLDEAPDFPREAQEAKAGALQDVLHLLAQRKKEDADGAELARLREQEAQHQREEAERRRALETAEQAQRDAQAALEAAGRREQEANAALARAEHQREESEERERQAESRRTREREDAQAAAIDAERRRVAAEAEAQRQEEARKANDLEHRRGFNREAMDDMLKVLAGDEVTAKAILLAIVKKQVRHISITY